MNIPSLVVRALRYVRRHRLNMDYDPAREGELKWGLPSGEPPNGGSSGRRSDWLPGVRAASGRRRSRGFVADDVSVSMYLGTRGHRSF